MRHEGACGPQGLEDRLGARGPERQAGEARGGIAGECALGRHCAEGVTHRVRGAGAHRAPDMRSNGP